MVALYMHVPIALVHMSLAITSSLVFVPLLAFPSYYHYHDDDDQSKKRNQKKIMMKLIIILMFPPIMMNVLIQILTLFMSNIDTSLTLIVKTTESMIDVLKGIHPLSSTYFITVYIPLHFMLSCLYFG